MLGPFLLLEPSLDILPSLEVATAAVRPAPGRRAWPGTRLGCVQYQSDLRCACGPQDGRKLSKNILPCSYLSSFFFRDPLWVLSEAWGLDPRCSGRRLVFYRVFEFVWLFWS